MNEKAIKAKNEIEQRELFIRENEQTILRIASKVTGKFITRSDDEWSVALISFNKAIDTYSADKGDFISFARVVIERALIDHYRSEKKYEAEISTSPEMLTGEGEYEENTEVLRAITEESSLEEKKENRQQNLKEEILEINERLKKYGFTFYDIAECSPKAGKTKTECAGVIRHILENENILNIVTNDGKLPIKEIVKEIKISKKLLDRYRRYIIMAVIVLNGEYPLLADYLEYIKFSGKEGAG
ncbi:MAG: sigma-70 family RNA polymerase sigma factor [Lachnospiraceae bacterium]|nr:sigma-70 family RNA polymerase sigma factor [Lachnospiraceae bacterium]